MKFDEVNLRFFRSPGLATKIVIRNSSNPFTSSHDRELFEMKQATICYEYGLKVKPSRGQIAAQGILTLLSGVFVGFVIQKEFFGILLGNYSNICILLKPWKIEMFFFFKL